MKPFKALAIATILIACIPDIQGADTLADGLVAYYPFNGNTKDESGNGWDGVGSPIPTEDRFGEPDSAYAFSDLSHHILIPGTEGLHLDSSLSISVWFKTTHTGPEQNYMLGKHRAWSPNGYRFYFDAGAKLGWLLGDTPGLDPGTIDVGLCDGNWHHLVGTYGGTTAQLYVDGLLRDSKKENRGPKNDNPFMIGTHPSALVPGSGCSWSFWRGALDDIRVYDRVLSEDEVLELYSGPEPALSFRRGDSDSNGALNITDAVFTLNHLFLGAPAPGCLDATDADDNGAVQITDAISTLNHLFLGGPPLPAPTASCGPDPKDDVLGCTSYAACGGG